MMCGDVEVSEDQVVRIVGGVLVTVGYVGRLMVHGNGPVGVFGWELNSFVAFCLVIIGLAAPETLDRLPLGPSNEQVRQVKPLKQRDTEEEEG